MLFEIAALATGLFMLLHASDSVVEHSSNLAKSFGISPIIIGVVLVAVGTDLPELLVALTSFSIGHAAISVGDIFGSMLAQLTLVVGIIALFAGTIKGKREDIVLWGGAALVGEILALMAIEKGVLTRTDGVLLLVTYAVLIFLSYYYTKEKIRPILHKETPNILLTVWHLLLVIISSYVVVEAAIALSMIFGIPEFIVGFFAIALGTSLPELSIAFMAVKKKHYGLAIGDLIGSNLADATLVLGLGSLLFPGVIGNAIGNLGWYVIFATATVIALFAWREKIDKRVGIICILLYLGSYLTFLI